jgi:hypothetical protein
MSALPTYVIPNVLNMLPSSPHFDKRRNIGHKKSRPEGGWLKAQIRL